MATSTPAPSSSAAAATAATAGVEPARRTTTRRPRVPGRRGLVGASLLIAMGSLMPWIDTPVGSVTGMVGAGLWTFYAAWIGIAGAMIPKPRISAVHGVVMATIVLGLAGWQVVHLIQLVGLGGWQPGVGLVFVIGGGVFAGVSAVRLFGAAAAAEA